MRESDDPIYRRIAERIEAEILSGGLQAGEKIPSERAIAEQSGVSRMTARHALRHLQVKGLIETRTGHGTFVSRRAIVQKLSALTGFTEDVTRLGRRTNSHIIAAHTIPADRVAAAALALPAGSLVHRLERIRFVDDEPVALEATEIVASMAAGLLDVADFSEKSLYATLREMYGVTPTSAHQTLAAVNLDGNVARTLRLEPRSAALKLSRLTFDQHGTPFEYVRSHYRGDSFLMKVELNLRRPEVQ